MNPMIELKNISLFKLYRKSYLLAFSFFLFSPFITNIKAQGNLLVTPKRVIFDGSKRSEELNLANTGKDSATYLISFIQIKMREDGIFEQIEKPDSTLQIASNNLRFFPRSVTLAPGEAQSVRVQIKNALALSDGEYRSHLYFRGIPNNGALGDETTSKDSSISVKIIPIFGLSMPIIIRKGDPIIHTELLDMALDLSIMEEPILKMAIKRTGNISCYGDIAINHISNDGGITRVSTVKGLSVYLPNEKRNLIVKLDNSKTIDWYSGTLQAVYTDNEKPSVVLAESKITLKK